MKKLLILSLVIFLGYGCKTTDSSSETLDTLSNNAPSFYHKILSDLTGLSRIMINKYCSNPVYDAIDAFEVFSPFEERHALYTVNLNLKNKKVLMEQDNVFLEQTFSCSLNKGMCNEKGEYKDSFNLYQRLIKDNNGDIRFEEYLGKDSIQDSIQQVANNQAELLNLIVFNEERILLSFVTERRSEMLPRYKACNMFKVLNTVLKKNRNSQTDGDPIAVNEFLSSTKVNKGIPQIREVRFNTTYSQVSYPSKETTYDVWTAKEINTEANFADFFNESEIKSVLKTPACNTSQDTVTISLQSNHSSTQNAQELNCKDPTELSKTQTLKSFYFKDSAQ